jgi:hypothetical protein
MVRKSQIRKLPHFQKVRKSIKKCKSSNYADLRFAEQICEPPTCAKIFLCNCCHCPNYAVFIDIRSAKIAGKL